MVGGGVVAAIGLIASNPALAFLGIAVHGLGSGATIAVRSAAFSDVFGGPNFGTIFGLLAVAYPIGGTFAVYYRRGRLRCDGLLRSADPGRADRRGRVGRLAVGRRPEAVTSGSGPRRGVSRR